ncbi:SusC/RagA family TonB-linked outer membrane protein [Zobellia galactanivorans]|uniref:TonB-dependent Receptor n=1 Tax=Zobellia galactanivorans (strain DSM 12802 / CCUG 47099 / CIP 106680 / NCIMB 13871 / Dsij) TaxID=63186 RepID=G0L8L0_ZOBGA|nr:TonB-dependent receptor [Zobellia galactanivorans]CAZ97649.1 TonB-dependent Receptor [Zobellia galactanivorans]
MNLKRMLLLLLFASMVSLQAQQNLTGTITDGSGQPLPGVNVLVKGTTVGTVADFDGNYAIKAPEGATLEFSYLGFITQSVQVSKQTTINVVLEEDVALLEEVVVIGYGTSTKKDLVSSVASVKSDVLENQPVARVDQALQGRATGVEVTSNNGTPGSGATIRIRGNSSINGNNDPLYVIDGFIAGTGFNLNTINVNDIASIEILKDATALSIYGTRGASGVILITTKNGKGMAPGKPVVTVNHYQSIQETANRIDILGGQDFIDYKNESYQFVPGPDGFGYTDTSLPLVLDPENTTTTDWLDLVEQPGSISNTDVSVTGNSENANYFISGNYFNQKGVLRGSGLERVNFRTNLDVRVSDRFKTGIRANITHYKIENNKVDYGNIVSSVLPIRPVYLEDGSYSFENPISAGLERNPEADIQLRVDHDLVTQIITNAYVEYEVAKNLSFKSTFGAQLNYKKENNYLPGILPERVNGGFGRINTNFTKSILNENTLNYNLDLDDHSIKVLGGFTWQKDNNESTRTEADQFPNDVVLFNNLALGDASTAVVGSGYGQRTLTSFLGRVNYGYKSKYLLTLVGRYDGSSVFETGNKYAFFPSIGAAWNVDEEDFLSDSDVVDRFKLRGSYGIVGEQGVAAYNSIATYANTTTVFNGSLVNGVLVGKVPSSGLTWETTKQLDLGIELGFLNNRISFEADYYKKTTDDLLLSVALSGQVGANSTTQLQNLGSVRNSGFEFGLNTINVQNENFTWESNLSISSNQSEILELDGQEYISLQSTGNQGGNSARLIVGEALPTFVGAKYLGTYKSADEIIADGREGRSFIGGPRYEDVNGDSNINDEDFVVLGSPIPDFYGGFRNTFTYKDLSLDVFFHGSYGAEIYNVRSQTAYFGRGEQNVDPIVLDRWTGGVNETSDIPRAGPSNSLFNPNSSLNIEDGSYLRLKTATLNYNVPLESGGLSNIFSALNVYVTGTNLLLFTDFTLGDPEVNNFTAGSGLNSVSQGFATGQYPYAKTITLGVKVEF